MTRQHEHSGDIVKIPLPIRTEKPDTARCVLQRLRTVFDQPTATGHRRGENPCRIVVGRLPKQAAVVEHFTALRYADLPAVVAMLREAHRSNIVKLALEFLILMAAHSDEVSGATLDEFDVKAKLWNNCERADEGRERAAPLSERVALSPVGELVFPGRNEMLSNISITMVLR
ncbi:hypothetical protein RLW55_16330 [Hyphomicrobium sp. B1]|uniref:tyrosine-type recombinase/integrase n=1 Tax=Hyphomicrobium sp. B1 TaxID=3075651 RepID=UPI003C2C9421